jgi:MtN3 and saliva related transmembrane protein
LAPSINWVEIIGFAAAAGTTFSLVPQLLRIWQRRSADDISVGMYTVFSAGVILWLVYGLLHRSWPIILANTITLLLSLGILALKFKFAGQAAKLASPPPEVRNLER